MKPHHILLFVSIFTFSVGSAAADTFPPLQEALDALVSDAEVTVAEVTVPEWDPPANVYYSFEPNLSGPTIGFIIYPGAYVDPRSYAPAAHEIAREGFLTVIVRMIDDLALGESAQRAGRVISDYPAIGKWAIGGHSMGGFGACAYAKGNTDSIDGVILWAAYPSALARLDDAIIKAVSIYGTSDGLVTLDEIDLSREHLPPYTRWVAVEGANHTQFGWYDTSPDPVQPGDNPAGISRQVQQDAIVQATVEFLNHLNLCPGDPDNDYDDDSVCPDTDNCPVPNGPTLGTCVYVASGVVMGTGTVCSGDGDCASGESCDVSQGDANGNGIGDSCECYADIDCNAKVDLGDLVVMKGQFLQPCPPSPCTADANADGKVDLSDLVIVKTQFLLTGCPACP